MSPEFRERLESVLDDHFDQDLVGLLIQSRTKQQWSPDQVKKLIDQGPYTAKAAAAAGLVIAAGAVAMPAGLACVPGAVGGVWLNKVSTKVTMQRLAISVVFIGLIRKFLFGPNSDDLLYSLYPQRGKCESSKTFSFVVWTFRILT